MTVIGTALLFLGGCGITDGSIDCLGLSEVQGALAAEEERPGRLVLLDPRPAEDYEAAHLPGARHVRISDLITRTKDQRLVSARRVIVYGDAPSSTVAKAMVKNLLKSGYGGVRMFDGGLVEWQRAGLPVETGADPEPWVEQTNARPPRREGGL